MELLFITYNNITEYVTYDSNFSFVDIISLIISSLAIVISFITLKLSKQQDIEYDKFQMLVLDYLNKQFDVIEDKFNCLETNHSALQDFYNSFTDLTLLIAHMQTYIPNLAINELQDNINQFTDDFGSGAINKVTFNNEFLIFKSSLLSKLYDYAIGTIPSIARRRFCN